MDNIGEGFRSELLSLKNREFSYKSASISRRLVALLIDIIVLNFIVFSPFSGIFTSFLDNIGSASALPDQIYVTMVIISFISLLYFSLLQHYAQQTIGMMVTKIYVVPSPGFWKSVVRNLFVLPFFPFNLLWIIEPIHLYFRKGRFLERITRTATVEVSNGP